MLVPRSATARVLPVPGPAMPSSGALEMSDQLQLSMVQARVQPQYAGRHARLVVHVHVGSHLNLSIDWLGMWNPADLTRPEANLPVGRLAAGVPSLTGREELTITVGVHRSRFRGSPGPMMIPRRRRTSRARTWMSASPDGAGDLVTGLAAFAGALSSRAWPSWIRPSVTAQTSRQMRSVDSAPGTSRPRTMALRSATRSSVRQTR